MKKLEVAEMDQPETPNPRTKQWDQYKNMPLEELAQSICGGYAAGSEFELKKLIYEQKVIERQFEYTKQQIELQHQKNTELVKDQVKWVKYSAVLTAISALTAAIAGALVTYMLTSPPQQQTTKTEIPQETAQNAKNKTSETAPERTPDKVPSSPSSK
jgi:hypothetical protein